MSCKLGLSAPNPTLRGRYRARSAVAPWRSTMLGVLVIPFVSFLTGCDPGPARHDSTFSDDEWAVIRTLSPLPAPPPDPTNRVADDDRAVILGQKFFFDPRFSGPLLDSDNPDVGAGGNGPVGLTGRVACARCHAPTESFIDVITRGNSTSLGTGRSTRNSPTLLNGAYFPYVNHDGRSDSLWSQALGAAESPVLLNGARVAIVQRIFLRYRAEYEAIFGPMPPFDDAGQFPQIPTPPAFAGQGRPGDGPGLAGLDTYDEMTILNQMLADSAFANFGKAIAAYERRLLSTDSSFDRFVAGDEAAIDAAARRGLDLFIGKGFCINCHQGPNFSDGDFHNLGLAQTGEHVPAQDIGRFGGLLSLAVDRFNGAGPYSDDAAAGLEKLQALKLEDTSIGAFRTPTLRAVASTAPYMHAGQLRSLRDVVEFYNRGGDGSGFEGTPDPRIGPPLGLDDREIDDLVAFLQSLTGQPPPASLTIPPVIPP